jgi:hypothetical protein
MHHCDELVINPNAFTSVHRQMGGANERNALESTTTNAIQSVMPTTTRGEIGRELITNGFDQFQPQKTEVVKTFRLGRLERWVQQFGGRWLRQSSGETAKRLMGRMKDCWQSTKNGRLSP